MCTQVYLALPADVDLEALTALVVRHQVGRGLSAGFPVDSEEGLLEPGERLHHVAPWDRCHCGHAPYFFGRVVTDAIRAGASSSVGVLAIEEEDERFFVHTKRKRKLIAPIDRVAIAAENFGDADDLKVLYVAKNDAPVRGVVHRHGRRRKKHA